jgi:excisionase family DNA binding protein
MTISEVRRALEEIRAQAQHGDIEQVVCSVDRALQGLDGGRLLTTTEAAEWLGIRSINTLKMLVRKLDIPYEMVGNRMMLPLAAVEGIRERPEVKRIQALDRAHDEIERLGAPDGLTAEEMADLSASRPGRLPWQTAERGAEDAVKP